MTSLSTQLVNTGISPNDGTGDNLRAAFNKTNTNIANISEFLVVGPTFSNANVVGLLSTDSITSNSGVFNDVVLFQSNTASISSLSGAIVVSGGAGVVGNLYVGGTINGEVQSNTIVAGTVMVTGGAGVVGHLQAGSITSGSLDVANDVTINGSLTVHGNVTTVTTTEFIVKDPIIEIGMAADAQGNPAQLTSNDHQNRGIKFYYFDDVTSTQQDGFFGFHTDSGKFTFTSNTTLGTSVFDTVEANILSTGSSIFNSIVANTIISADGVTGILLTHIQPNITSVGTLSNLNVASGGITVIDGDIHVNGGGTVYVDGNQVSLSAQAFTGGVVPLDTYFASTTPSTDISTGAVRINGGLGVVGNLNIGGSLVTSDFTAATLGGVLTTNAQPNITTVGTLGNLVVTDNFSCGTASVNNLTAGNFINASTVTASTGLSGLLLTPAQPNITSVGTLTSLDITGNITAANFTGSVSGNITGNISGSASTVTAADQPTITSVGALTSLTVTGSATVGSVNANSGLIQTTGNIQSSSSVVGSYLYGQLKTAAQPNITTVGTLTSLSVNNSLSVGGVAVFAGNISAAGSGTQPIGSTANRFGTVYSTAMNVTGVVTAGSFVGTFNGTAASIVNQSNSATINATSTSTPSQIVLRDASGNFDAGIINATATTAQYADLAEMYQSDGQYDSGTVLVFGGTHEVTVTGHQADVSVAGVVSTAPAYLMNIDALHAVAVALRGKVPVKVIGPVKKGDLLVTSYMPGYAVSVGKDSKYGVAVFAKAVEEDLSEGQKIINAVII